QAEQQPGAAVDRCKLVTHDTPFAIATGAVLGTRDACLVPGDTPTTRLGARRPRNLGVQRMGPHWSLYASTRAGVAPLAGAATYTAPSSGTKRPVRARDAVFTVPSET